VSAAVAPTTATADRLLDAAEELFAARGIEAVSLREITRVAGARNVMAAQYHFGDRDGLVRAIMARHASDVEARRHALLDAYEAGAERDLRTLAAAFVRPLAAKLDAPSGRCYLAIYADVLNRPRPRVAAAALDDPSDSNHRWRQLVGKLVDRRATEVLHRRFGAILHVSVELARRAKDDARDDDRLFVSDLVDVTAAILATEMSHETERLLRARKRAR
jgi:AcrR family transcriptional regulator